MEYDIIKTHNFENSKNQIKRFADERFSIPEFETYEESYGLFGMGTTHVTCEEMNKFIDKNASCLMGICERDKEISRQFMNVYNTFEYLDKDYIREIIRAVEDARKAAKEADKASRQAKEVAKKADEASRQAKEVSRAADEASREAKNASRAAGEVSRNAEYIAKAVGNISEENRQAINKVNDDIGKIWSYCDTMCDGIEVVSDRIDKLEKYQNEMDFIQEQEKLLQEDFQGNKDITSLIQKVIDTEKEFSEYKSQTESIFSKLERKIKYAYFVAGGSLGVTILGLIIIIAGGI